MLKTFIGAASALALMAMLAGAHAQTANSNAGAVSSSGANSQSGSSSSARVGGNQTLQTKTDVGVGVGIDQRSYGAQPLSHTTTDATVRAAPTVYAPPVSGGNPCTLAVSGGVSVIGWGASAGGTFVDEDCANRQKIAMIHNAGYAPAARELMCNDRATYHAFKTTGLPCAWREAYEPKGAQPTPVMMPTPIAPQQMAVPVVPVVRNGGLPPKVYPRCSRTIVDDCQS